MFDAAPGGARLALGGVLFVTSAVDTSYDSASRVRPARRRNWRKALVAYSFIAPNFLGFAIFTLGPILFAFALAFMHWDGSNPIEFAGLDNFWRLWGDRAFITAFWNTIIYTALAVPLTIVEHLDQEWIIEKIELKEITGERNDQKEKTIPHEDKLTTKRIDVNNVEFELKLPPTTVDKKYDLLITYLRKNRRY